MMTIQMAVLFLIIVSLQSLFSDAFIIPVIIHNRPWKQPSAARRTCHVTKMDKDSIDLEAYKSLATKIFDRLKVELLEASACAQLMMQHATKSECDVKPEDVVLICDSIDELQSKEASDLFVDKQLHLRYQALKFARYHLLVKLMKNQYDSYVATASFLSPSRIDRWDLPNVQDVPIDKDTTVSIYASPPNIEGITELVEDCKLDKVTYNDSLLDQLLLKVFRKLVQENTGGVSSSKPGIEGLLEQGRLFMIKPGQTPEAQHKMVKETLGGLMTPYLPPFYRIFMAGIVPEIGSKDWDGKQLGPWFYAPWLTSLVTPTFFAFLVGPSRPNRRKDGSPGGLLVEKCKFLQQSGCKGLCLHQCKIPAQEFFSETLGLDLTVSPNFATQECQWSFGEKPLPTAEDPSFPKGCLVGCESRSIMASTYSNSKMGSCNA